MKLFDNSGASGNLIKMSCTTAVQFYVPTAAYVAGQVGQTKTWTRFSSEIGETTLDVFWADWRGSYGTQQVQSMSMGVYDLCTLRMDYHPGLYDLLRRKEVLIVKNAAADAVIAVQPAAAAAENQAAAQDPADQGSESAETTPAAASGPVTYIPVRSHPDLYSVWGAVDDIREAHKIMEFKVRRWEAK